jgi:hypothetical protein
MGRMGKIHRSRAVSAIIHLKVDLRLCVQVGRNIQWFSVISYLFSVISGQNELRTDDREQKTREMGVSI